MCCCVVAVRARVCRCVGCWLLVVRCVICCVLMMFVIVAVCC